MRKDWIDLNREELKKVFLLEHQIEFELFCEKEYELMEEVICVDSIYL